MTQPAANLTGNWRITSQSGSSEPGMTMNAGMTSQVNGGVTAIAHLTGASCVSSSTPIQFAGSVDDAGKLSLKSAAVNGTTVSLKAQLGSDGKSLTATSLAFAGGSCQALGVVAATSTQYAQINGTYAGNFTDTDGDALPVNATLSQTTDPDANGQFHLSGSATFPNNPCFTQPVITDSLVTGQDMSTTYSQGNATIQAVGTFNADATQLTVTNWTVTGGLCDQLAGTGLLTKQP
jgi:hypothetical protein